MTQLLDREAVSEPANPLGLDGIEFIEFATSKPQALGGLLETIGFRPIALPLMIGAGMKIAYDLLLYAVFRKAKPPEEAAAAGNV